MALLKKVILALFVSVAMLATAPSAMAKPAGKIENQTQAEVEASLDDTVAAAEETLAAMQGDADKETVLKLLKNTKQTAKTIQSIVVFSARDKALARVNKARSAFKKGKKEEAVALMEEAVQRFKDVKTKYHNF